ncbi:MAG: DNA alkylation repair protein [Bacteroidales bacterium]|nr:DNA alkylation repair protein [Bacteroidales bacterium]
MTDYSSPYHHALSSSVKASASFDREPPAEGAAVSFEIETAVRAVKSLLRATMNGVASRSMRDSGIGYKLIFGTELPRLRQLAEEIRQTVAVGADHQRRLANVLWQENIRECKLLAIMIFPLDQFDRERAGLWVESIEPEQAELSQLLAMDLLSKMPFAPELAFSWMADERQMFQLCGFLTLTRLLMQGVELSPQSEAEFLDQAAAAWSSSYLPLRRAVGNALMRFGERSDAARQVVEQILGR